MKLALVIFLNIIFVAILFFGIAYQCIVTKEHPVLGIYIMITYYINLIIVSWSIYGWLKKIFDIGN